MFGFILYIFFFVWYEDIRVDGIRTLQFGSDIVVLWQNEIETDFETECGNADNVIKVVLWVLYIIFCKFSISITCVD